VDIVVLVLWMFNAGAGFYLLVTSNLSRGRAVPDTEPAQLPTPSKVAATAQPAKVAAPAQPVASAPAKAGRVNWDPPSLARAKSEPIPGLRPLLEFSHPALGITGFGFWAGYTLSHNRILAVIAFGVLVATVCAGLSWFARNTREARRRPDDDSAPSFRPRLVVLHGVGATLTFLLAALVAARI
jgi:hypothetical protein